MTDAPVGSPEWWLRRLHGELIKRRNDIQTATDYYDGLHNLSFQSQRFREAFDVAAAGHAGKVILTWDE